MTEKPKKLVTNAFNRNPGIGPNNNVLIKFKEQKVARYIAREFLSVSGVNKRKLKGAGVFDHYSSSLQLTKLGGRNASIWQLPHWFYPTGSKTPLTYHSDLKRWKRENDYVQLNSVARGQEFVLDCRHYPEATRWVGDLLSPTVESR